ncbi:hypothetical protein cce_3945 [Crocosphaera subtropica ATCC 51142]|uniref:Ice-binding protein C-terminal domain-containing protein n=2 Tax=Crocosphaera TaxID=263510 RepID=B1WPX8_CROS5|nr:hypothetical protein cce_3945 [Crocosphaera subtropica ATCC 51142]
MKNILYYRYSHKVWRKCFMSLDKLINYSVGGGVILINILTSNIAQATTFVFNTSDFQFNSPEDSQGYWSPSFDNNFGGVPFPPSGGSPNGGSYALGEAFNTGTNLPTGGLVRSFVTFDLSSLADTITSAKLQLQRYTSSGDPIETLGLFEVSTNALTLNTPSGANASIYDDLGTGTSYGTFSVTTSGPSTEILEFQLNANGISAINNNAGGFFSIGMSILSLDRPNNLSAEYLFAFSTSSGIQRLILETASSPSVPEPSTLLGLGLLGLGTVLRAKTLS